MVEQVAADVEVLALAVERRDLGGRDDGDAVEVVGDVQRLGDAVDRVVVGQREQLDAGRVRRRARPRAGGSAPSLAVEWDCRSKVGAALGKAARAYGSAQPGRRRVRARATRPRARAGS